MKALEKIRNISEALALAGIQGAYKEAELFVSDVANVDLAGLYRDNPVISKEHMTVINAMAGRRSKGEPLQYIMGHNDFLGLRVLVGPGVLIPRPETELMVEHVIKTVKSQKSKVRSLKNKDGSAQEQCSRDARDNGNRTSILDLCTGSGCIALALAGAFPEASVWGVDISEHALAYAKKNQELNEIDNLTFAQGNLFDALNQNQRFDLIISNPPYIRSDDIGSLQPEIRDWEPLEALDGGSDGRFFYRKIISEAPLFLKEGGLLAFELGADDAGEVARLLKAAGYDDIKILKDYSDVKRIIEARWTK